MCFISFLNNQDSQYSLYNTLIFNIKSNGVCTQKNA